MATVYLLSYAKPATKSPHPSYHAVHLHNNAVRSIPLNTPYLYTIDCTRFVPPPAAICSRYDGTSAIVQELVMQDTNARNAVDNAVANVRNEIQRGRKRMLIKTCCALGTHRSVAVAEVIRQELESSGVSVEVRHPHKGRRFS